MGRLDQADNLLVGDDRLAMKNLTLRPPLTALPADCAYGRILAYLSRSDGQPIGRGPTEANLRQTLSSAPVLQRSPASYARPPQSCLTQSDLGSLEERVQNLVAEGARHAAGGHTSAIAI